MQHLMAFMASTPLGDCKAPTAMSGASGTTSLKKVGDH